MQYGGLVVALSGFGITRLFVAEALQVDSALPFIIAGLLPLAVGLGLTAYGVALAVGPFTTGYVNAVARWHLLGVGAMAVVFVVTGVDQFLRSGRVEFTTEAPLLLANVLLGGAVGGTLTGIRSGRMIHQRQEIRRSANRALFVNRLLRHEVLNAATIIDGHADVIGEGGNSRSKSVSAIRRSVQRIVSTVEEVGTIAENGDQSHRINVGDIVRTEIEDIESEHGVDIRVPDQIGDIEISADRRIALVVRELLENAIVHGGTADVAVELHEVTRGLELSITDHGPGLSESQRALLEDGDFPEFDDPRTGFGLQIVRLLVVQFGGEIRVRHVNGDETGTRITVLLPRSDQQEMTPETVMVSFPNLKRAIVAGAFSGIVMGIFYQLSTGLLPVIGSLYAIQSPLIGWITHLFHSMIFGLLFATICAGPRISRRVSGPIHSGLFGFGWGVLLWFVAAGVIMPAWLTLVGIPTRIPNLSIAGFVGHALWGVTLGVAYWGLSKFDVMGRRHRPD